MKNIFFITVLVLVYGALEISQVFAQPENRLRSERRIEELARIKLAETLNLDEERSVRFFSRRNEHIQKIEKMKFKKDELLDSIEKNLSSGSSTEESANYKKMISGILKIDTEIEKERNQFIQSLSDILSEKEICMFFVFERNFQRELRNMLLQHRQRERGRR